MLGQAQGREGGETPQKNITLEVGFSHHLKIGGGTFWMIKPYVIKKNGGFINQHIEKWWPRTSRIRVLPKELGGVGNDEK